MFERSPLSFPGCLQSEGEIHDFVNVVLNKNFAKDERKFLVFELKPNRGLE